MSLNQLEFKYPGNFLYFLIPLAVLLLFILSYKKKEKILQALNLEVEFSHKLTRIILAFIGIILIVFSLLGPQIFEGVEEVEKKGLDIYVLIDTSKSMLSEDIKPDRINRAKNIIKNILDNLEGDRIGFIPFSSDAYIQMPLTEDHRLAQMFLNVIDTEMIAGGGTNIKSAVNLAADSFERTSSSDKVIIIISDGEAHDWTTNDIISSVQKENIRIYSIGVGTEKGGLIPVIDIQTGQRKEYKKNKDGEFVVSRLNEETLKDIANSTDGLYIQSSMAADEANKLVESISSLKRERFKTDRIRNFRLLYQYFLGTGLLLFIIVYLLSERRRTE
ncbi:MAG: VWA domain-containing protein [Bacillota bacterium]